MMRGKAESRELKAESLPSFWLSTFGLCLFAVFLPGCGRKAILRAPEDVLPQRIADLSASNVPDGIQLAWSRPRTYVDGSRMTDLSGFVIERAATAELRPSFQRISVLEVTDRDRFRQVKRFRYLDRETIVGTEYSYRVVSFTIDRYFSVPSNVVTVERTTLERNPSGRTATGKEKDASFPATRWRAARRSGPVG